jgi:TrmH family RNA methyltransferase
VAQTATPITSRDNQWLKRFRAALAGEHEQDGVVGVEGLRLVETALHSGVGIEAMLVSDSGKRHLARLESSVSSDRISQVRVVHTTDRLFAGIADTQAPQGVAALVRPKAAAIEDLVRGTALVIVLAAVQDPGNVGTILRAAEAFGATGAVTCSAGQLGTANPFSPKVLRASAGSALRLPILRGVSSTILFPQLRMLGLKIHATIATAASAADGAPFSPRVLQPWQADWKSPVAIVIGNEGAGLPEDVLRSADALVSIPQSRTAESAGFESLNAAMAATILLYEAMRQRGA